MAQIKILESMQITKFYKIIFFIWALELNLLSLKIIISMKFNLFNLLIVIFNSFTLKIAFSLFSNDKINTTNISKIIIIIFWITFGWKILFNFIYNNYLYISNNILYLDSPATIIVVYINTIFGLLFPLLLSISLILNWKNKGYKNEKL